MVIDGRPLSDTVGAVLDPIFSLRLPRAARRRARRCASIFSTVVAAVARARSSTSPTSTATPATFERAATLAWTQAQVQLHHLGIEPDEAHLFQRLANRDPVLRPVAAARRRTCSRATSAARPALWAHGISGDLPIVLVRIDEVEDLDIVRQLLRAHEYWRHEAARRSTS